VRPACCARKLTRLCLPKRKARHTACSAAGSQGRPEMASASDREAEQHHSDHDHSQQHSNGQAQLPASMETASESGGAAELVAGHRQSAGNGHAELPQSSEPADEAAGSAPAERSGGPGDAGAALAAFRAAQERRARQYAAFGSGFQSYLRTRDEAAFRCGGRGAGGACGAPHQRSRSGAALRNPELARQ